MQGPLSYIGGKSRIANQIISLIPEHKTYVEAFAGGAQVLFRKEPSVVEVLNDLDGELVNFYRVCQSHHEELMRYLKFTLLSRRWYEHLLKVQPDSLTDIQRGRQIFLPPKMLIRRWRCEKELCDPHYEASDLQTGPHPGNDLQEF
jgi:DNA adenine methylase